MGGEAAGELDAAVGNAEEEERLAIAVAGGNSFGEPLDRGVDFVSADRLVFCHEVRLWLGRWGG